MRPVNGGLRWRPIVPGSDLHCELLRRSAGRSERLGRVLYPSLHARRDAEAHRRACAAIASSAASLTRTKQNAPDCESEAFTAPRSTVDGIEDGCSSECA